MKLFAKGLVLVHVIWWDARLRAMSSQDVGLKRFIKPQPPFARARLSMEQVLAAVNVAYSFLPRNGRCLAVAIVTASAVRAFASDAKSCEVVLGVKPLPFCAHAWVEADGKVVQLADAPIGFRTIARFPYVQ